MEGANWFGWNDLFSSLFPDNSWCPCQNSYVDILIISKTSSIWLRCNFGLFPKSHFIKQPFNHFQLKAALIGALFLVDFMYGEKPKWLSKKMHLYIPSPEIYTLHKLAITESNYIQKKYWYQNINTDDN